MPHARRTGSLSLVGLFHLLVLQTSHLDFPDACVDFIKIKLPSTWSTIENVANAILFISGLKCSVALSTNTIDRLATRAR